MDHTQLDPDVTRLVVDRLAQMLRRDPGTITPQLRLLENLSLDSGDALELLMHIENDAKIQFDPETLFEPDFETVGALVTYVSNQRPR